MKNILSILFLCVFNILSAQTISEIQGTGASTPFLDQEVSTTGIVTAVNGTGYFIQDGEDVRSGIYVTIKE